MKYVLLQSPDGQIKVIDNSGNLGKGRVQKLINDGYDHIGYIESELTPYNLHRGFNSDSYVLIDGFRKLRQELINKLEGYR